MGGVRAKHDNPQPNSNQNNTMAIAFALAIALSSQGAKGGCGCHHHHQQQPNPAQQLFGMGFMMGAQAGQMNGLNNPMAGFAQQPFAMQQNPLFGNLQGNYGGGGMDPSFAAGLGFGTGLAMGAQGGMNPGNTLLGSPMCGNSMFGPQMGAQPFGQMPFGQQPFGGPPQNPMAAVVGLIMRILQGGQMGGGQNMAFAGGGGSPFAFAAAGAF